MGELKFQKLTPTQDVDLSGYEDAFHYIFAEDDIKNIAISGAYSSGKSSVIESYKKKHPEKKFMHLSLAHFQAMDGIAENEPEEATVDEEQDVQESVIEGKILNQLIQQIPADKIPQTNFQVKRSTGWKKPAIISVALCIFFALFLHCTKYSSWKTVVYGLNEGLLKKVLTFSVSPEARIFSIVLLLILIGVAVFQLIIIQHSKNIFRKVSVQGNEIEIFSDCNDSYFDKYLNEVLYLFENTDVDGIVFEDIDRFDNHIIFERLREINTLTNIRLANKKVKILMPWHKDNKVKKQLRFFYLLRDDIFENKDRTKFFDYIMPVVPVLDSSNSYNKVREYLENAGIFGQFDDHFLRGVSLYIDDLRVVKNIFNEFLIYNHKLNAIELDVNKLFAIIVYKNIFPKDFADLQLNQGFVHTLFDSKDKLIANRIAAVNEAIAEIEERISFYENEHLESQAELDVVKASKERIASRSGSWSQQYQEYQEWCKKIYPKRKKALEDKAAENILELKKQAEQKKEERTEIENLQLEGLLDRQNTDEAFHVDCINEIARVEHFYAIKGNPYFPLLKYLISRGYIDESYSDYMTFFYPNSLSIRDKVFLRAVADRTAKQANYELDSPALVTENLNEYDFSQPETLNYTLSEYILLANQDVYIRSMILQLEIERRFDYIAGYMRSGKNSNPMVAAIDTYWPEMFQETLVKHALPDDLIKVFSYMTLIGVDEDKIDEVNIDCCLRDYVSGKPDYLKIDNIDVEKLGRALSYLQVSFVEIDPEGINETLFEYVHQHDLYDINASNIRLMLGYKCHVEDIDNCLLDLFTFLSNHQVYAACRYMWSQKGQTISAYLEMYTGSIRDASETIVDILNTKEIEQIYKKAYVERLETRVTQIDCVTDSDDQKLLINHLKVDYTVENVLYYFGQYGLTGELITFINSDDESLDYLASSDEPYTEKFLDKCICEVSIKDEKYRQIMENICDRMQKFDVEGLSEEKVRILIDLGLIDMNPVNLKFMRVSYPNVTLYFIRRDIELYIPIAVGTDFDLNEATSILEWSEVSDKMKVDLLKQTTAGIGIQGKHLNDNLIAYVLDNNLSEKDLPWILECYDDFSDEVKTTILRVASEKLEHIVMNYAGKIDKVLLGQLYQSETADFASKVHLLEATSKTMKKDQLYDALNSLGADKIADNINGGKKKVRVSNENKEILQALYNAGVIFKPEKAADGQNYKKIKYKSNNKNEVMPASLL